MTGDFVTRPYAIQGRLGDVTPALEYKPGTWGPQEANRLTADVGGWHSPQ